MAVCIGFFFSFLPRASFSSRRFAASFLCSPLFCVPSCRLRDPLLYSSKFLRLRSGAPKPTRIPRSSLCRHSCTYVNAAAMPRRLLLWGPRESKPGSGQKTIVEQVIVTHGMDRTPFLHLVPFTFVLFTYHFCGLPATTGTLCTLNREINERLLTDLEPYSSRVPSSF